MHECTQCRLTETFSEVALEEALVDDSFVARILFWHCADPAADAGCVALLVAVSLEDTPAVAVDLEMLLA